MSDAQSDYSGRHEEAAERRKAKEEKVRRVVALVRERDTLAAEIAEHDKLVNDKREKLKKIDESISELVNAR